LFRVLGIVLMLLAIALVAVPRFTDCQSQGEASQLADGETTPMKCHWSGIAEIGVAIPLYLVGAVMTTSRRRNVLAILSVLGIVLGGLAIAFPTKLIGVCPGPTMLCSTLMKPLLILLGSGVIGLSGLGLFLSRPAFSIFRASLLSAAALSRKLTAWKGV
jgi:hypothetical protein